MSNSEPTTHRAQSAVAGIPPGNYVVDPARSGLRFRAKAFGLIWVHGQIPALRGSFRVSDGRLSGTGELAATQVSTGLRARDWHLRTGHYLHTARHPEIQVSVQDVAVATGAGEARIVVRGHAGQVPLHVDSATLNERTLTLEAHGTLDRTPFGMLPPLAGVSRLVHVVVTVVATRADGPGAA